MWFFLYWWPQRFWSLFPPSLRNTAKCIQHKNVQGLKFFFEPKSLCTLVGFFFFFFWFLVRPSLSFLVCCVYFLPPFPKAAMPEGPWPRCITSWEPQKAKAGGKWGRQRTYPALSSQLALFTCPLPSPLSSIHKLASTQTPAHKSQGPQGEEQAGLTPKRHRWSHQLWLKNQEGETSWGRGCWFAVWQPPSQASGWLFRTGDEGDTVAQVWFPMAPGLPGAHHDDPQVAVISYHCTRHLFLLLSRRHHPCKLPLPTMTFSLVPKSTLYLLLLLFLLLLSCQRSGLGLGTEGRSLAWVGSPTVPQPAIGTTPLGMPYWKSPCPRLVPGKAERKAQHSTQLELEVVLAQLQPHPSQASEKGDSEALAEFHSNLFWHVYKPTV